MITFFSRENGMENMVLEILYQYGLGTIFWIPTQRKYHNRGNNHFIHFYFTPTFVHFVFCIHCSFWCTYSYFHFLHFFFLLSCLLRWGANCIYTISISFLLHFYFIICSTSLIMTDWSDCNCGCRRFLHMGLNPQ